MILFVDGDRGSSVMREVYNTVSYCGGWSFEHLVAPPRFISSEKHLPAGGPENAQDADINWHKVIIGADLGAFRRLNSRDHQPARVFPGERLLANESRTPRKSLT